MIGVMLKPTISLNGKKYKVMNMIGEGGFAYVYQVMSVNKDDKKETYALKKMICQTDEQLEEAKKEIEVMIKLNHSNVLPLIDFSYTVNKKHQKEVHLLLPLYQSSVQNTIDHGDGYPYCGFTDGLDVVKVLRHCAEGLFAIHQSGFRHADLKPGNILISESYHAVITDFGSAMPLHTEIKSRTEALTLQETAAIHSTASYRAPELFNTPSECVIDGKADVWAFGCTMYTMLWSRSPFERPVEGLSTLAVLAGEYPLPLESNEWPEDYVEIIKDCLQINPVQRLDIENLRIRLKRLSSPPLDLQKRPIPVRTESPINSCKNTPERAKNPQDAIKIDVNAVSSDQIPPPAVFTDFADFNSTMAPPVAITDKSLEGKLVEITAQDTFNSAHPLGEETWGNISENGSMVWVNHTGSQSGENTNNFSHSNSVSEGFEPFNGSRSGDNSPLGQVKNGGSTPGSSCQDFVVTERLKQEFVEKDKENITVVDEVQIKSEIENKTINHQEESSDEDEFGDFSVCRRNSYNSDKGKLQLEVPNSTSIQLKEEESSEKDGENEEGEREMDFYSAICDEKNEVLKEGPVWMMRMGGFPKKLVKKTGLDGFNTLGFNNS